MEKEGLWISMNTVSFLLRNSKHLVNKNLDFFVKRSALSLCFRLLNRKTYLRTENALAIFPMARILWRITSFLAEGTPPEMEKMSDRSRLSGSVASGVKKHTSNQGEGKVWEAFCVKKCQNMKQIDSKRKIGALCEKLVKHWDNC